MNPNLRWKAVFVFAVVFLCVYGLFACPTFPTSLAQLRENFGSRIKLGLDLQGGTHLILQVQVNEAVSQQTDQALDHLTTQLRDKNIHYDELRKVNDTQILVHNLAPESAGAFRDLVDATFPDWSIAPAAGETSGYLLTMKPSTLAAIQAADHVAVGRYHSAANRCPWFDRTLRGALRPGRKRNHCGAARRGRPQPR